MALIKKDDQVTLEKYSVEKVFIDKNHWKWTNNMTETQRLFTEYIAIYSSPE